MTVETGSAKDSSLKRRIIEHELLGRLEVVYEYYAPLHRPKDPLRRRVILRSHVDVDGPERLCVINGKTYTVSGSSRGVEDGKLGWVWSPPKMGWLRPWPTDSAKAKSTPAIDSLLAEVYKDQNVWCETKIQYYNREIIKIEYKRNDLNVRLEELINARRELYEGGIL